MTDRAEAASADRPAGGPRRLLRLLPLAVILLAVGIAVLSGAHRLVSFETVVDHWAAVTGFVRAHIVLGLIAFVAAYAGFVLLSLPGSSLFTMMGGALFGSLLGGVTSAMAATLGATGVYLVARTAFGQALARNAGSMLGRIAAGFQRDAFNYLLFLRLVPAFPFWLINLAPALFGIPLRVFVLATGIGILPAALAFAAIGTGLHTPIAEQAAHRAACLAAGHGDCPVHLHLGALVSPTLLLGLAGLGVLSLVPILLRRFSMRGRKT